MIDLNDVAIFVKVAQLESFSRAGLALNMPVSTVSRRVAALEEQLRTTLIQRTTRKLSLTAQGRAYYAETSGPLNHLFDAEIALVDRQREPKGILKITAPVALAHEAFYEFLSSFLKTHVQVQIDISITNAFLDLVADNVDVAIRFGDMADSTIVAQRIGTNLRYLVATPGYLETRSHPARPEDLRQHDCILLNARDGRSEWELFSGKKSAKIEVSGRISSRDLQSLSVFTHKGHGIGLLPTYYCEAEIRGGSLIRILPEWSSPEIAVHAVYPSQRFVPLKTQAFLAALKEWKSPLWLSRR